MNINEFAWADSNNIGYSEYFLLKRKGYYIYKIETNENGKIIHYSDKSYKTLRGAMKNEDIRKLSSVGKQLLKNVLTQHKIIYPINSWERLIIYYGGY